MSKVTVEFLDGRVVDYDDVFPNHVDRILEIYKNGETIGFFPYEGIFCVKWSEEEKEQGKNVEEKE